MGKENVWRCTGWRSSPCPKPVLLPILSQANDQVEAVSKNIKYTLKTKHDVSKRTWVDELSQVLWVIRTTWWNAIGETPTFHDLRRDSNRDRSTFPSSYSFQWNRKQQSKEMWAWIPWRNEGCLSGESRYIPIKIIRYCNAKVKKKGDILPRRLDISKGFPVIKRSGTWTLGSNWKGPYLLGKNHDLKLIKIESMERKLLPHHWNIEHLKKY